MRTLRGGAGQLRRSSFADSATPPEYLLIALAVVLGSALSLLVARSMVLANPVANGVMRALLVASWGATGLLTWRLARDSRLGALMIGLSWLYAATSLMGFRDPSLFTIGRIAWALLTVGLVYTLLAFPTGRVREPVPRAIVRAAALATLAVWLPLVLGARTLPAGGALSRCSASCPPNALRVFGLDPSAVTALSRVAVCIAGAALLATGLVLLGRARALTPLRRRISLLPLACLSLAAVTGSIAALLLQTGNPSAAHALGWLSMPAFLAFPYAMVAAQARQRALAATALRRVAGRIARHEPRADLRAALAEVLDDPTLKLGFEIPAAAGYVDAAGRRLEVATADGRSVTEIVQRGRTVAVILHHPRLHDTPGLVEAAGDAVLLVLENARLEAELRAAIDELRASRARIVAASEAERRRLEQDVHDSAQQRLVALRVRLGLAEDRAAETSPEMRQLLADLGEETQEAIEDLRSIAQGIYPPMLASSGLEAALAAEGMRTPLSVHVSAGEVGRSAPEIEAAVYFCCLEALQNAAKHAGASVRVSVELHRDSGDLAFSVHDDGRGFDAFATSGMGLTNMRDRIGAAGGRVRIASTPGEGTTVAGTVPWLRPSSGTQPQRSRPDFSDAGASSRV